MAVVSGCMGWNEEKYIGCVLNVWERNGYNDSDFYATVWDDEKKDVVDVMYDTTRAGGGGYAKIDATPDVLRTVYRHYKTIAKNDFDHVHNIAQAKKIRVGDTVQVVRGRKIAKGTECKVFWVGTCYNQYKRAEENRVGVIVGEGKKFLNADYVEIVDFEKRLLHGKDRENAILDHTLGFMPVHFRRLFAKKSWEHDSILGRIPGWKTFL